jgi:glycosyltransferase involved in cell wall biosynthesis
MRILFCNYEYPPFGGGGGAVNALLAERLATRHEVTVLTSQGPGVAPESVENDVRVLRVPVLLRRQRAVANLPSMFAYMVQGVRRGRDLLRAERFDLINTHFVLPTGPAGDALARFSGLPNVLSLHGGDIYDPSKWISPHRHALLRAWVRYLLRRADHVVGQSADTIANVHRFYAPDLPVTRIPLGIRRPPPGEARRSDHGLSADQVLLVTVGRLVPRKAVDQLIALMVELPPSAHLLVIGDGPKAPQLQRQAAELGLGSRVSFLGLVSEDDKFRLLRMADLFVSTSEHEGFGLVFLEAMACGLPVVCYDRGGQTDFLEDGTTGHVVASNDRIAFARSLSGLIERPILRRRLGSLNQERVEAYYIDHCARRYEQLFEQVIGIRRPPARVTDQSHPMKRSMRSARRSR